MFYSVMEQQNEQISLLFIYTVHMRIFYNLVPRASSHSTIVEREEALGMRLHILHILQQQKKEVRIQIQPPV